MTEFGAFRYDAASRVLSRDEAEIPLSPRVLAVLESLLKRPGKIVAKEAVLESAWEGAFVGEDSLTKAISQLRSALGDDPHRPRYIQTIPKRGYRFIAEVSEPLRNQGPIPRPVEVGDDGGATAAVASTAEAPAQEARADDSPAAALTTLAAGTRLGRYELLAHIGAGAMGEVWRARDTELQRDVAIKVVPKDLAGEAAVIERFRREALMLAAVNHPNIATIHGVEDAGGTPFIVMELLQGETLQERLQRGPLPADEALELAAQIARALEVAHNAGIIHRDLKPANIMLGADDHVKVLDFGLAKDINVTDAAATVDPTLLTESGLLIGTAAYMSPEQAAGKPIDRRSDIFSFGCILFEMLTARRPFPGDNVAEIVAATLKDQPDWELLPATTPVTARALLRRCLRKNPDRRLHDIADARIEIEVALTEPEAGLPGLADPPATDRRFRVAVAAIGLLAGVGLTVLASWALKEATTSPAATLITRRLELVLPSEISVRRSSDYPQLAVSPNGEHVVFRARRNGVFALYRRPLAGNQAALIPGTEGGNLPFFSPEGEWLGFFANRKLWKVRLDGGELKELCEATSLSGATWGPDGTIVFSGRVGSGLWKVSEGGGRPERIASLDSSNGERSFDYPAFLPDGKSVLVGIWYGGHGTYELGVVDMETGKVRGLGIERVAQGVYIPTGHIVFGRPDGHRYGSAETRAGAGRVRRRSYTPPG